ncbi:MAG: Ig-like domain-containing protein [Alphaproteobacteria bacterium]|nr:Ig-like domain-containing protein [Alphaproteobacteria bacterium]
MPILLLTLLACGPGEDPPVVFHDYPAPDAFTPPAGPGGPAQSYDAAALFEHCAYLLGGEGDAQHHNLVVMHDGYLLNPWAPEDGGGGITFFEFDDPCNPTKVGEGWSDVMRESHSMAIGRVGDREYLAVDYHLDGDNGGIGFWDITDRTAPVWVSELALPDYHYPDAYFRVALSTFWQGDILYVSSGLSGVFVVDASDPLNPAILEQYSVIGHMVGSFHVIGNVGMASSAGLARTIFYDVSDPTVLEPIAGGEFNVSDPEGEMANYYFSNVGGAWGLFARKDDGGGPILYDITDPSEPTWLGSALNDDGAGGYIFRHEQYLFQGESDWATIFDASDPTAPVEVARLDLQGDLDTITPIGNVAVLAVDAGANDGQATAVAPWDTQPDARGPRIELTNPADGDTWVATTARVGLSFDEMVEWASVFEGSVRVWADDGAAVPGRFNVQESIVNFTPDEPLRTDTTYIVEVPAGGVTDISGNPTEDTLRFAFSTGAEVIEP